jgi:hypothetical protein
VTDVVTLAVPCRADEPDLAHTLAAALASWRAGPATTAGLEILVCVNGPGAASSPALRQLAAFAVAAGLPPPCVIDADQPGGAALPEVAPIAVVALLAARAGKANAWNVLRSHARGRRLLFLDADVSFAPETFAQLLTALDGAPAAVLASARTRGAPRPTAFERIVAAPYGVAFPNLSPQLYAARAAGLPPGMPDDLLEPERWLELVVGRDRIVHAPGAEVRVRLTRDLRDFFRQRIRIEMGKVQIANEYPGLGARAAPQPGVREALRHLPPAELARLAVYLGLRTVARLAAEWRYRRGRTAGVWRQAASTKAWDGA